MRPDARWKLAMMLQDDPYRSIRRHVAAALLLLALLAASAIWFGSHGM